MTRYLGVCLLAALFACGDNLPGSAVGDDDGPPGPQCNDHLDNDADGTTDFPDDLGCDGPLDDSEDSPAMPRCSDHRDNDGDGKVDFPDDPGCLAPLADDETDDCPDGPGCPQCGNGRDDDLNGKIDYPQDFGCTAASDTIEFSENPVACGANLHIELLPQTGIAMGTLDQTSTSTLTTTCGGGGNSPAIAYVLILTTPKIVVASTDDPATGADTILDIRSANCSDADASIACNDDARSGVLASKLTVALDPGVYYILVEGHDSTVTGPFTLTVELFAGEGSACTMQSDCGPGLVCRVPSGGTNMVCSKPVCSDGADDDGDGKIDFPNDPGCAGPSDGTEEDDCPAGAGCPACANGLDDDADGSIDFPMDSTCASASGFIEGCGTEQDAILPIGAASTTGTTVGAHDDHDPSCTSSNGPDVQFTLQVPAMRSLAIDTEDSAIDTVVSLRAAACSGPSLACDDDGGVSSGASLLELVDVAAGNYVVAVDGFNATAVGAFDLNVTGVIAAGGSCENDLFAAGAFTCETGFSCDGPVGARTCRTQCSDGIDNNGDGTIDFPNDPGCASPADDDENTVCPGATCPACSDGVDNDGDGQTDFPADPSCLSAGGTNETCAQSESIDSIVMPTTTGTTVGQVNDYEPACGSTSHDSAADVALQLDLPAVESLTLHIDTTADAILVLLGASCGGSELACRDALVSGGETITMTNLAAGRYFVIADGFDPADVAAFTLQASGTIAAGGSCESPLVTSGVLACAAGFVCDGPVGARTCRTQCSDGADNNGDGTIDFPDDPGCSSPADNSEDTVCPGAACPQCADGADNDGDGLIDFGGDPNCASASDDTEAALCDDQSEPVVAVTTKTVTGTTVGATNDINLACGSSSGTGPDVALQLDLPAMQTLGLDLTVGFDSVHALVDASCTGPEIACRDPATLDSAHLPAGRYFVIVDGFSATASGAFTLTTSGIIEPGGSCESPLFADGAITCPPGLACIGLPGARTCFSECADGVDNNGDGRIDFPADPGCTSTADPVEDTIACPGASCPVCADTSDNDGDLLVDFPADFGCASAAAASEAFCAADADFGGVIAQPTTTGTLAAAADNFEESCQSSTGNEMSFALALPVRVDRLVVDTFDSTISDTVLSVKDASCTVELACDDDGGPSGANNLRSIVTVLDVAPGNYAINVDSFGTSNNGAFTLHVKGTVAAGTSCTSSLFASGVLVCPTGTTCSGGTCN